MFQNGLFTSLVKIHNTVNTQHPIVWTILIKGLCNDYYVNKPLIRYK